MPVFKLITRTSFLGVLVTLITACAGSYDYSQRVAVLPLSVVQVNTQLEIPAGEARVYIQFGKVIAKRGGLDRFLTYCSVLMQNLHVPGEPLLTVSPGLFEVREVRQYNDGYSDSRILVASAMWMGNGRSVIFYTLEMRLRSTDQPDVRALFCVKESDLPGRQYPTFEEIKIALGDVVTIEQYLP
jgi:hypothetical protein